MIRQVQPHDLIEYGMIPEFVGRLPVLATLDPLSRTDMVRVLQEPRNALVRQYQQMFSLEGASLEFDADALLAIADKALERDTGVRALRSIIEEIVLDTMFELPDNPREATYRVTKRVVEGQARLRGVVKRRKTGS
jgi:ATP-dependent Clp protease ATP-binding subunit ClpX